MTYFRAFRAVTVAAIGISVGSAGCIGAADDTGTIELFSAEDHPLIDILSGPGGCGGTNGFDPLSFHLYKYTAYDSMNAFLASPPYWNIHTASANQALLMNLLQGRETLRYAIRCALGAGVSVWGGFPQETFTGHGILTTTPGWRTASLGTAQKEDLFSCMLAHLNSLGIHVPIMLSGPSVRNAQDFDGSSYDFDEALWGTAITYDGDGSPNLDFFVWPSQQLDDYCALDLTGVLNLRLCGSFLGECNLTVRTDRLSACSETTSGWVCDGRPVIQTRLRSVDLPLLYAVCLL